MERTDREEIVLPQKVRYIIETLEKHGYGAYAVGGCVRDALLKRSPEDWDITTSAFPEEVKTLFSKTIDTGIVHGTITVRLEGESFEVTTYRIDGEYLDRRRPKQVCFTRNLREDLLRRDFTINAMAYHPKEGLVDCFEGKKDLFLKKIRCVGNPRERLTEDALRILRGLRFAAQLGFEIDAETKLAMTKLAKNLSYISVERVQVELTKLLTSPYPERLMEAKELGITKEFLPEFDALFSVSQETPHHQYNVGRHTIESLKKVERDKVLRLTMLLHDIGKPDTKRIDEQGRAHFPEHTLVGLEKARKILKRLRYDNETIYKVLKLIEFHDVRILPEEIEVRKTLNQLGKDLFELYLKVQRADVLAQSDYQREKKLKRVEEVKKVFQRVTERGDAVFLSDLKVTGKDVLELGIPEGRQVGEVLNWLLEQVIVNPSWNEKKRLMALLEKKKSAFQGM